jgi:protocatechuate 3,4-dioxygenase beta subunit
MTPIVPHDDAPRGRLLTRREALAFLGVTGATLLGRGLPALAATPATAGALPSCVARPAQTEGPFFVEEDLNRSDIRSDPRSGEVVAGVPLRLAFRVSRIAGASCAPLAGAQVDVWHCDATGRYSDVAGRNFSAAGPQFLRGYQLTDAAGAAQFLTIYPGWYGGRAVHVHFKIRTKTASARTYDFTSQLYFDDALNDRVQAVAAYSRSGRRPMRNADDFLFRNGGRQLLLDPVQEAQGYAATFDIGLQV